jgi:hypothetical protein
MEFAAVLLIVIGAGIWLGYRFYRFIRRAYEPLSADLPTCSHPMQLRRASVRLTARSSVSSLLIPIEMALGPEARFCRVLRSSSADADGRSAVFDECVVS